MSKAKKFQVVRVLLDGSKEFVRTYGPEQEDANGTAEEKANMFAEKMQKREADAEGNGPKYKVIPLGGKDEESEPEEQEEAEAPAEESAEDAEVESYEKLSKKDLLAECKARKIKITGSEDKKAMIALLEKYDEENAG